MTGMAVMMVVEMTAGGVVVVMMTVVMVEVVMTVVEMTAGRVVAVMTVVEVTAGGVVVVMTVVEMMTVVEVVMMVVVVEAVTQIPSLRSSDLEYTRTKRKAVLQEPSQIWPASKQKPIQSGNLSNPWPKKSDP